MAFDQTTRNRLARFVSDARALLTEEFTRQMQHEYGLDPTSGETADLATLSHLDDARRETARILRETMEYYLAGTSKVDAKARREVLDRIVREQAFTILNRLAALRMAEARGLVIQSVAQGYNAKGFQLYARLAGPALGEMGDAYRQYLLSLFDEFAVDLPVLFDRFSPQGRLFPREAALLKLLGLVNDPEIDPLWAEDETIGWIYQYFNSKEERQEMRAASQAPRNSRELAVRNQFFTPRYVVEFLTDNTLGRIWYEMTQGQTGLVEGCRYLVRRPNEIFLQHGEQAPEQGETETDLSQEELLHQLVYIPYRPLKDPRDLKMLDPACGSMHFGLYAFDLFETIYAEAWALEERLGARAFERSADLKPLHASYPDEAAFLRDVPRLIIERNIHGVDIDPRAVQIAGLSLWLRAQRSWQSQGMKASDRPQIRKSNVVCADPMPGDKTLLEEFLMGLREDRLEGLLRRVLNVPSNQKIRTTRAMAEALANLLRIVWQEMELAGEAGSLLKIDETLTEAIQKGKSDWEEKAPLFRVLEFGLNETQNEKYVQVVSEEEEDFWDKAETLVLAALNEYAEQAENGGGFRRKLFAEDTVQGFAFVDVCRKVYDVILMNPPFGDSTINQEKYLNKNYTFSKSDLASCFIDAMYKKLIGGGMVGSITARNIYFLSSFEEFRREVILNSCSLLFFVDMGVGVLDAMVSTALIIIQNRSNNSQDFILNFNLSNLDNKAEYLSHLVYEPINKERVIIRRPNHFSKLPSASFSYWASEKVVKLLSAENSLESSGTQVSVGLQSGDDYRFFRLAWEVDANHLGRGKEWCYVAKGGEYSKFWDDIHLLVFWSQAGASLKSIPASYVRNESNYFRKGLTYPFRTIKGFNVRCLPKDCVFTLQGMSIFTPFDNEENLLFIAGLLNSHILLSFLRMLTSSDAYQVGYVKKLPIKMSNNTVVKEIASVSKAATNARISLDFYDETCRYFKRPYIIGPSTTLTELMDQAVARLKENIRIIYESINQINDYVQEGFQLSDDERNKLSEDFVEPDFYEIPSEYELLSSLLSYLLGVCYGRWNLLYAFRKIDNEDIPNPFATLPACPPGMLMDKQGLPAKDIDLPSDYPIKISWSGILTDDENHRENVEKKIHEALYAIWHVNAESIEQGICQIMGVKSLREFLSKPNLFFNDHIKKYSKSRRIAPIYWPFSTSSGLYTLWLYYPRLTDQTLFTCVNDFVDPKIKQVAEDAARLRQKRARSAVEEKELERLSEFESELKDFRTELLRVASFWKPDLNDGVEITAAPLWRLFQHKPWQKRLKATWEKLEAGEYDWAHLAYSIWPERVREKCKTDKSLAIAHGLEHLYVEKKDTQKKGKKRKVSQDQSDELFG